MARQSWFFRLLDSRFMKAVNRLMLKLPYPVRFAVVLLVLVAAIGIAVLIEGMAIGYGIRPHS